MKKEKVTQNRFKSVAVYIAFGAAALLVGQAMGLITVDQSDLWTKAIQSVLAALVGIGVLNNPTNKTGF
jgi:uncharacterized membrane protein